MSGGLPTGVQRKHSRRCPAHDDEAARCRSKGCKYQVQAGPRGNRKTRTFATVAAATTWKREMDAAKSAGRITSERAPTLRVAAASWEADARAGVALARGRKEFKAGTVGEYVRLLEAEWLEPYGAVPLDVLGEQINDIIMGFQRRGFAASTVRNMLMPLRAIYRHAVQMRWVAANPTMGAQVPAGSGRRMIIVEPRMIPAYLAALDEHDRPLWAAAFDAGARRGELQALRWSSVDLASGFIRIDPATGNYDQRTKEMQAPKSKAGVRRLPITGRLREFLVEHRMRAGARPQGLVFARATLAGSSRTGMEATPFNDSTTGSRARKRFIDAGLPPITLHDARHTFASTAIDAMARRGIFNPKMLQEAMGHSSIQVTYDRYGHLFPGAAAELASMLDDYQSAAALPEVAQAWSRLQAAVLDADVDDARPVVTQALAELASWQDDHPCAGSLVSSPVREASGLERAVIVQRSQLGGRP